MDDPIAEYESGPDATLRAGAAAWQRVGSARAVLLVEGVSDQIALDVAARQQGADLAARGVVVVPINGAHAFTRALVEVRRHPNELRVGGLCDVAEEGVVYRAIAAAGLGDVADRSDLEELGFFVCVDDLEDELLRAAGPALVADVIAANGDRASFSRLQAQPAWRGAGHHDQVRRFIAAGARRKHRYAASLVAALGGARLPEPLARAIEHVS